MADAREPDRDTARRAIALVDLTDLSDGATTAGALAVCDAARRASVAAVCVWPRFVADCAAALADDPVSVATVVNFPSGDEPLVAVAAQTERAIADGADEIDVVLPYRAWLAGDVTRASEVLDGVRSLAAERVVKVIVESGALPDRSAIAGAGQFAIDHGADFVKTSTGKTPVSATLDAAAVLLDTIAAAGRPVGFKASGGIRRYRDAVAYLEVAERIMGPGWVTPATFRFGASGLLDALRAVAG